MPPIDPDDIVIGVHLLGAVVAGGMIGLERSFHGRPAGFRTHTLVCLASSLLMLLAYYPQKWMPPSVLEAVRTDPTRMAQGIMTGIGFLGAGVIFHRNGAGSEKGAGSSSVKGLTTAATVWLIAALGIGCGLGHWPVVAIGAGLGLLLLVLVPVESWIERRFGE